MVITERTVCVFGGRGQLPVLAPPPALHCTCTSVSASCPGSPVKDPAVLFQTRTSVGQGREFSSQRASVSTPGLS